MSGSADAIWDDGEWISWAYINEQIELQESEAGRENLEYAAAHPDCSYTELTGRAAIEESRTGKTSRLWGTIGERFVAEKFGVVLSRANAEGHDGHLGKDLVEIKTITPG